MKALFKLIFGFLASVLLSQCDTSTTVSQTQLDRIKQSGTLHVLTRMDPTTYYQGADGYTGLEYDLITLFAEHLGVKPKIEVPSSFEEILHKISNNEADIAAAGLTITESRKQTMRFAPAYQGITEQVIYRSGTRKPTDVSHLSNGIIEVIKGTSHQDTLEKLKQKNPRLSWEVNEQLDTDGLLYLVNEGLIDYTIADSNQATLVRRFYPKLNNAFDISPTRQLAWALSKSRDNSLYDEVTRFFEKIKADRTLDQLLEKHYGHTSNLSYVDNCQFRYYKKSRLPLYQDYFNLAAMSYSIDWRLLAAIGYQESHWSAKATSPYGVQGIMMLTNDTATQLNIKNRTDPAQSIDGGARYFRQRLKIISDKIPEPDRTWFALASYNVGMGHLEDARRLTAQQGGNPDKWIDVKKRLPLLTQEKWHQQTKHGFARGKEPVRYVENIRSYYDLLVWLTEDNQIQNNAMFPRKKLESAPENAYVLK